MLENKGYNSEENMESLNTDFYRVPETSQLNELIEEANHLRSEIDSLKAQREDIVGTLYEKEKVNWTYNSNAIEGSTLTLGETAFFLEEGTTAEGKPFKDYLEARNHANAIDFLYQEILKQKRDVTPGLIKEINVLLLNGITDTLAVNQFGEKVKKPATPGQYKKYPNHVLKPDGEIHYYVEPLQVPQQIESLCQWIKESEKNVHPIISSAISHYNLVRIHPFDDGNGRGARILMNIILLRDGYSPAIIQNEQRREYISCIGEANNGDIAPFTEFVAQSLIDTQKGKLSDLQGGTNT